jgi:hypothetical protein
MGVSSDIARRDISRSAIYVLSLNNSKFSDFVDRIYPIELEIKDTTDTDGSAS